MIAPLCALMITVLVIIRLYHSADPRSPIAPEPFPTARQNPVTVMVIGTSLSTQYDWPEVMVDQLATCLDRPVDLIRITRNGATSRWGSAALARYIQKPDAVSPDVVLIEFTVNDADIRHRISPEQSAELTREILKDVTEFAPEARVVLLGMYSGTGLRGALRLRHAAYLDQYQHLAHNLPHVGFRDMAPDWDRYLAGLDREKRKRSIPDGLHPDQSSARAVLSPAIAQFVAPIWQKHPC